MITFACGGWVWSCEEIFAPSLMIEASAITLLTRSLQRDIASVDSEDDIEIIFELASDDAINAEELTMEIITRLELAQKFSTRLQMTKPRLMDQVDA